MFEVGDTVVYPHHGAGEIVQISQRQFDGRAATYLTIKIIHSDLTVMCPVDNVERAGIRSVIPEQIVEEVVGVLRDDPTRMPQNWNRRYKHNREKIKSGDVFELADVVRNLALLDASKGLSTGEKQMFGRVKRILASEFMYAKQLGQEEEALAFLEGILTEICAEAAN